MFPLELARQVSNLPPRFLARAYKRRRNILTGVLFVILYTFQRSIKNFLMDFSEEGRRRTNQIYEGDYIEEQRESEMN